MNWNEGTFRKRIFKCGTKDNETDIVAKSAKGLVGIGQVKESFSTSLLSSFLLMFVACIFLSGHDERVVLVQRGR